VADGAEKRKVKAGMLLPESCLKSVRSMIIPFVRKDNEVIRQGRFVNKFKETFL